METVFGNESYLGSGRWNNIFVKLVQDAYPFGGDVEFLTSYWPEKMVIYGYTSKGYFEGNFKTSVMGTPKDYVSFQYRPFESITGFASQGDVLFLESDPSVVNHFVMNCEATGISIQPTSVLAKDIQFFINEINRAQKAMNVPLAQEVPLAQTTTTTPPSGETQRSIGDQTDELLKAKSLLDLGAISEEEFADLKKKILGA